MSNNSDIIDALNERRAKISARFETGLGNSAQEVRQVLGALDHPASYYTALTNAERDNACQEWSDLADRLGVHLPKARTTRAVRTPLLPPAVVEFFGDAKCIPRRPYASDDPRTGIHPRDWDIAAGLRSIQINPPEMQHWLIFDCDHDTFDLWREHLPEPSYIAINPDDHRHPGHHHVAYKLAAPVCRSARAHRKPIIYLRAVQEAMRRALGGDPAYTGLITKNPLHPDWRVQRGDGLPTYELGDLAAGLDLRQPRAERPRSAPHELQDLTLVGIGMRNKALFDVVRHWAYAEADGPDSILEYARRCNELLPDPLPDNEVRSTARSIAAYIQAHRHGSGSRDHQAFVERQRGRGRKGGQRSGEVRAAMSEDRRASVRLMAARGMSSRQIAAELGVNQSTIVRWLKE